MRHIQDLVTWAEEMAEQAKQRQQRVPLPDRLLSENTGQLPIWPEPTRGVPNGVLRSALFGAIKKGPRSFLERKKIAALDGIEIHYTGQQLDQGDLDIWETVLHINRLQEMGQKCRFRAYALLKMLGRMDTGGNREVLHKRLLRLRANAVEIKQGSFTYIGGLIDEVYKDDETQEYIIVLNPQLRSLFAVDQFTQIDWSVRHALNGKPLAQWLHGYYASHAKPYPINIDVLLKLSGSENSKPRSSHQKLREALDALTDVSNAHNQPFSYKINGDLVYVEKEPSRAQRRHLARKVNKR
jgi:hypothetical protein